MLIEGADRPGKTATAQEQRGQRASLVSKERRQLDPEDAMGGTKKSRLHARSGLVGLKIRANRPRLHARCMPSLVGTVMGVELLSQANYAHSNLETN
jgi:hypothetical protein